MPASPPISSIPPRPVLRFALVAGLVVGLGSLLLPDETSAQITNGDFEDGPSGWSTVTSGPEFAVDITDANCGDGIQAQFYSDFDNPGGRACIAQDFTCGVEGADTVCTITLDYRFNLLSGSAGSARLLVSIDGEQLLSVSPTGEWTQAAVDVACGQHTIEICMDVVPSDNAWTACVDDVNALCTGVVSTDVQGWGTVKGLFR
jgi:hypothetical protein